jgi:hypothetical protein
MKANPSVNPAAWVTETILRGLVRETGSEYISSFFVVLTLQNGSVPKQLTVLAKLAVDRRDKDKATIRFFIETPI